MTLRSHEWLRGRDELGFQHRGALRMLWLDMDRGYRRALLERGVFHFPLACKQGSISAAHTDEDLAFTLEVTREALKTL